MGSFLEVGELLLRELRLTKLLKTVRTDLHNFSRNAGEDFGEVREI
jgi:hypothetical protein